MLRYTAWVLSAVLHGAIALSLLDFAGREAMESGGGDDLFSVEHGITIEGIEKLGIDEATVQAVETPPSQFSVAQPQVEEVKADEPVEEPPPDVKTAELPEKTEVVQSIDGPEQDALRPEVPEKDVPEPRPQQIATLDLPEEIAVREERSAGPKQTGGDATTASAYLGKLRTHLGRNSVNPRSRLTGKVVVRFTVDPAGQVISREVTQSSGHRVLDDAAVASLDRASPLPAFTDGMRRDPLVVFVPFKFVTR